MADDVIEAVVNGVLSCLKDTEMPVRLEAAITLKAILKDQNGLPHQS